MRLRDWAWQQRAGVPGARTSRDRSSLFGRVASVHTSLDITSSSGEEVQPAAAQRIQELKAAQLTACRI